MEIVDYVVIVLYLIGIVGVGMMFAGRMKNSKEMFSAGGQSPWWVSGLSAYMTTFSAATFVVWGGIAYKFGFVAIFINLGYGVAAILVGKFVAGKWRELGVDSASEYLHLRYGGSIVQFYTWFKGTLNLFSMGGGVYALSKIVCALIPLPADHLLADPSTGYLSVTFASVALCVMVIFITFIGGLWAVLMTDVLQFVILTIAVLFVVPLILMEAGGWTSFLEKAPAGFTNPVAADFGWWFLVGWMLVNFFIFSSDWTFVQRYLCVPKVKDAKNACYLFGTLYIVSPIIWMMPPLVYRVLNSDADSEQAYVLACQLVLPAGMMGLMIAAMASATASMATTRLNVFAGAFTTELYHRILNKTASVKNLVFAGRVITVLLGGVVLAGSLLIPKYGYTSFLIEISTLLYGPLLLPTIWGMFSKKIGVGAVWVTISLGFLAAFLVKFGLSNNGFLMDVSMLKPLVEIITEYARIVDLTAGIIFPIIILSVFQLLQKKEQPGWARSMELKKSFKEEPAVKPSTLPAKIVTWALFIIAIVMTSLALVVQEEIGIILAFSFSLFVLSGVAHYIIRQKERTI